MQDFPKEKDVVSKDNGQSDKPLVYLQALWDYDGEGIQSNLLSFKRGEIIKVLKSNETNWWTGCIGARKGFFPVNYTREYIDPKELVKTVQVAIKTVFQKECFNFGLNAFKQNKVVAKKKAKKSHRNSLPKSLAPSALLVEEERTLELEKNDFSALNRNLSPEASKKSSFKTLPISLARKLKKKSILHDLEDEVIKEEKDDDAPQRIRSFSDPCVDANSKKMLWRPTKEKKRDYTDIRSDNGITFRIKESKGATSKNYSFSLFFYIPKKLSTKKSQKYKVGKFGGNH